jgi:hypothetical protein
VSEQRHEFARSECKRDAAQGQQPPVAFFYLLEFNPEAGGGKGSGHEDRLSP